MEPKTTVPPKPLPSTDPSATRAPNAENAPDPRRAIDVAAQREEERRQAMADLVKASRGGGLFSITHQLSVDERQDIMSNAENAKAWQKLQGQASRSWLSVLGPLLTLLGVLILLGIALIFVLG